MVRTAAVAVVVVLAAVGFTAAALLVRPAGTPGSTPGTASSTMKLTSSAFSENGNIPTKYTADGINVSPPFQISGVEPMAATLAIVVEDLDAGNFTHWIIWNIPPNTENIPEDLQNSQILEGTSAKEGRNDFGSIAYSGPDPPAGPAHSYRFKLLALNSTLSLASGSTKSQFDQAISGHVIAEATLTGKYGR
ncbi:MAG: YbhB/YbcL family Raf kinase inhibitor-like protein [Candidatus Hadarchaeota archaeon]